MIYENPGAAGENLGACRENVGAAGSKMRRVYVLGGTSFARKLATGLEEEGHMVRLSVATPLGGGVVSREPRGGLRVGRLDAVGLCAELRDWGADVLVDAGHPYARELRGTAEQAARSAPVPLIRACRRPWRPVPEDGRIRFFSKEQEIIQELSGSKDRALFTVGSKGLRPFAGSGVVAGARVLPTEESVRAARACGLPVSGIIAAFPPFSAELTVACMRHLDCSILVSKESGEEGGLDAKLEAVRRVDGELFILDKPEERADSAFDLEEVTARLEEL